MIALLPTATRCPRCDRRVRWVDTPAGSRCCVDADPHPQGDVVLVDADGHWVAERRRGYRAIALRDRGLELHRHHDCTGYSRC